MKESEQQGRTTIQSPRIVEIIGPAGVGKSTLVRALLKANTKIVQGFPPDFKKVNDLPFFTRHTLSMLPTLFRILRGRSQPGSSARLSSRWMVWMVMLNGWHHRLKNQRTGNDSIVILDQGPIFMLTSFKIFGPSLLKEEKPVEWWKRVYDDWSKTLDLVIWLDAPNPTLLERVRNRPVWHGNKERTEQAAYAFIDDFRQNFEHVVTALTMATGDLKVKVFNTEETTLEELVPMVMQEFGL